MIEELGIIITLAEATEMVLNMISTPNFCLDDVELFHAIERTRLNCMSWDTFQVILEDLHKKKKIVRKPTSCKLHNKTNMPLVDKIGGQEVINWLQDNQIARILIAEIYAIKCEQESEEDENGEENTYDKLFIETLNEVKSMEAFK